MQADKTGTTTIAPSVLNSIVRLTTLEVPGVSRMATTVKPVTIIAKRHDGEGVKVLVDNGRIFIDVYVVLDAKDNVRLVGEEIQARVKRAISQMVGMEVAHINVHITDIDLEF
jgi:uncharacterized alkaline shock family protein YloU